MMRSPILGATSGVLIRAALPFRLMRVTKRPPGIALKADGTRLLGAFNKLTAVAGRQRFDATDITTQASHLTVRCPR